MADQQKAPEAPKPPLAQRLAAETHAATKGTPAWLFRCTAAAQRWPQGRELTEAEYNAAVSETLSYRIGGR